ncbi:asparaginyl-tRNA synthetase [Tribolium castaneum]|uniref:asparagine--tRNA ligase n=1 Tax=Tribolium castaneum TaxID=7070 RepID=D2A0S8_TRICA|nr:PREDICTED: probable asparagine--tRNA ligase, mitochondrial [Tribolium castaneum]EFA01641.1 putative asparagine--tRNA ligase, mitochondrial-like Protein [Tribolium castaneum]|eukprot:XP_008192548.1 PREDICTED: probable asparagine--tRNA ligase, mitochondrial [Tribolium castaneum]
MFKNHLVFKTVPHLIRRNILNKNFSSISQILDKSGVGDVITVKGWIKSLRDQKEHVFFDVSDGSTAKKLQILLPKKSKPEDLSTGASVVVSGPLTLSPKGQLELTANSIEVCGKCVVSEGYPFAPRKQYAAEYIRQYLHFRPRTHKFGALLRLRNAATLAIYNHFNSEGFVNVHTPVLTSNDCEGAGEVFKVVPDNKKLIKSMAKESQAEDEVYFNQKSFLTVSGQLHLEAVAHGLSKVYTFGPTFRAENSKSRLHLSEFYMLEGEIAFVEKLDGLMTCIEQLIKQVTKKLVNDSIEDIEKCQEKKVSFDWLDKSFPVVTYKEAVTILSQNKDKFSENFDSKDGFGKEHEMFLVEYFGKVPTFVIDWPKDMKPFYMKDNGDGTVAALDLLGPNVGEVVGGSLRENNYEKLLEKIPNSNGHLDWYLDLRKFGSVPTGGFGLGFERYLQLILGISNIKDTIPFPRWPHNCSL